MLEFLKDLNLDLFQLLSYVASIVITFLGVKYNKVKKAMKEVEDLAKVTTAAMADDKITPEELKGIAKESNEAMVAIANIFK